MEQKRRVLITGASKGIGRAALRKLHDEGYCVVGIARSRPTDLLPGETFYQCDLSDIDATKILITQLAAESPFYGIVNNVAKIHTTTLEDCEPDELYEAARVNLAVALICTKALLPGMKELGVGRIVNISSRASLGKEKRISYSATKGGLISMGRSWALELAAYNITVNAIAPGPIETESFRVSNPAGAEATIALKNAVPVGRTGTPEEIAHAISYLLHELSGFITGQTLHIDGGLSISTVKI